MLFGLASQDRLLLVIEQVCKAGPLEHLVRGVEEFLLLFQSYYTIAFISELFFRKLKMHVCLLWSDRLKCSVTVSLLLLLAL